MGRHAYDIKRFNNYKLNNADEVAKCLEEYFNNLCCDEDSLKSIPTVSGLANALGVARTTLDEYRRAKGENIPDINVLEEQIKEVRTKISNRDGSMLSFANRPATKTYLKEMLDALELRKIINIISYGYSLIEEYNQQRLYDRGNRGAIFVLKNAYGYTDEQSLVVKTEKKFEDFITEELLKGGE